MESKPLNGRRCYSERLTFNRTSMESKRVSQQRPDLSTRLLIEPVWNRNKICVHRHWVACQTFNRTSMESKRRYVTLAITQFYLLIEPVWNRNAAAAFVSANPWVTFNRTSMESKPRRYF